MGFYMYDKDGYFISIEVEKEYIPEGVSYTEVPIPDVGHIRSKFNPETKEWEDGATPEYIESIKYIPPESDMDKLKKQQADLMFELMMKGVI
jgi:hypothetical protein